MFPAIKSEVPKAVAKHKAEGRDVSAFTSYIESGNTVLYPITDKAPQINLIVQPTLEEFLNGDEDAAKVMKDMNEQVNNQLQFAGDRVMAVLAHLTPLTALLAIVRGDAFARAHGRAALRFHLSLAVYFAAIVGVLELIRGTPIAVQLLRRSCCS